MKTCKRNKKETERKGKKKQPERAQGIYNNISPTLTDGRARAHPPAVRLDGDARLGLRRGGALAVVGLAVELEFTLVRELRG
jgi:hypothetical protein